MRWYNILPIVVLIVGAYTVALAQGEEKTYIPSISGGIAGSDTPTFTATPTPTNTTEGDSTATSTNTPTNTPTTTPTTTPTNTPTLTPTVSPTPTATDEGEPDIIYRNNASFFVDLLDRLILVGEIQNIGNATAAFVDIDADLLNSSGQQIATAGAFALDRLVPPGESACFAIAYSNPPPSEQIDTIRFTETYLVGGELEPDLVIFNVVAQPIAGGFEISGTLRNDSDHTMTGITVAAAIYEGASGSGLILRCQGVTPAKPDLNPGDDTGFVIQFPALDSADVGSYFVEAQSVVP